MQVGQRLRRINMSFVSRMTAVVSSRVIDRHRLMLGLRSYPKALRCSLPSRAEESLFSSAPLRYTRPRESTCFAASRALALSRAAR